MKMRLNYLDKIVELEGTKEEINEFLYLKARRELWKIDKGDFEISPLFFRRRYSHPTNPTKTLQNLIERHKYGLV